MTLIKFVEWQNVMAYISDAEFNRKKKIYPAMISKKMNLTYAHLIKIIKELKLLGLLDTVKEGRTQRITLTNTGKIIGANLLQIRGELKTCKQIVRTQSGIKL